MHNVYWNTPTPELIREAEHQLGQTDLGRELVARLQVALAEVDNVLKVLSQHGEDADDGLSAYVARLIGERNALEAECGKTAGQRDQFEQELIALRNRFSDLDHAA